MLYKIVVLLLEVVTGLLTTTCLLRLYMQQQRIPLSARSGNPLGRFVFALTDWIVLPLRRVVPALGPWDMASLVAAFLIQLAHFGVLWALNGFGVTPLSIVVLAKGETAHGVGQLVCSLIVSPIVYFIGLVLFVGAIGVLDQM